MGSRVKIAGCFTGFDPERPEGYPSGQRGQTVNLLAYAFGGSNPPPSTKIVQQVFLPAREKFNGRTPAFQADGAGSIPGCRSIALKRATQPTQYNQFHAHEAQSVEHHLCKDEVEG